MKKLWRINRNKGFSLIDLTVVVSIVGSMAAVAIPQFNRFQQRARIIENKSVLTTIYEAEKTFASHWEDYDSSLAAIGFTFEGRPRTEVSVAPAATPTARYATEAPTAYAKTVGFTKLSDICGHPVFGPRCVPPNASQQSTFWGTGNVPGAYFTRGGPGTMSQWRVAAATNVNGGADEVWTIDDKKSFGQVAYASNGSGSTSGSGASANGGGGSGNGNGNGFGSGGNGNGNNGTGNGNGGANSGNNGNSNGNGDTPAGAVPGSSGPKNLHSN
jgi:Tfp pilus assembly major pilin PilA